MKKDKEIEQSSVKDRLIIYLEYKKLSQKKFEEACRLSNGYVNNIRQSISSATFDKKIAPNFPDLNKVWLLLNKGEMLITEEKEQLPASDLKPKIYGSSLKVRLVTNTAKAGWSDGFYSEEYLEDMPFVMIDADEEHKGQYMAFEVDGDSMEPDYMDGNIVICREVQRHLWQSKLHYKEWDFVIAHAKEGIYLKEIIDHDVEKGIITCHSINPAYPDFKVNLREVTFLYNVVETRQQGKRKRLNRAKDFFENEK